jgi:hypothetical protein
MADESSKYDIDVTISIRNADGTAFQDVIVKEYGLDYETMHAFQVGVTDAVRGVLVGWGDQIAEEIKGKRGQGQAKQADKFER